MIVLVNNRKLKAALEDPAARIRLYGADMAKKIGLRMDRLTAAESLGDFWPPMSGPERCHELTGDKAGQFSMDLKHPYRLLFCASEPKSKTDYPNEKERWLAIKSIEVLSIEDTHG